MNLTTTLSTKGQITIPSFVVKRLRLKKGTKIDIEATQDGFIGQIRKEKEQNL